MGNRNAGTYTIEVMTLTFKSQKEHAALFYESLVFLEKLWKMTPSDLDLIELTRASLALRIIDLPLVQAQWDQFPKWEQTKSTLEAIVWLLYFVVRSEENRTDGSYQQALDALRELIHELDPSIELE